MPFTFGILFTQVAQSGTSTTVIEEIKKPLQLLFCNTSITSSKYYWNNGRYQTSTNKIKGICAVLNNNFSMLETGPKFCQYRKQYELTFNNVDKLLISINEVLIH